MGFFYLTGHGVPTELSDRLLAAARRLFALPQAAKDAVAMTNSPHFRGYTRLGGELTGGHGSIGANRSTSGPSAPRWPTPIEDYLRLQGPNQWPAGLPELPEVIAQWDAELARVGRALLRRWAVGLGADPGVFDAAFADAPATLDQDRALSGAGRDRSGGRRTSRRRRADPAAG